MSLCCCQAFNSLGEAAYDAAQVSDDEEEPQTYALSPWFQQIVGKLLEVTDRYKMMSNLYVIASLSKGLILGCSGHKWTDCERIMLFAFNFFLDKEV